MEHQHTEKNNFNINFGGARMWWFNNCECGYWRIMNTLEWFSPITNNNIKFLVSYFYYLNSHEQSDFFTAKNP